MICDTARRGKEMEIRLFMDAPKSINLAPSCVVCVWIFIALSSGYRYIEAADEK